jgi:hypothetical protein
VSYAAVKFNNPTGMIKKMRPSTFEYNPYFERYISLVPEDDVVETLRNQLNAFPQTLIGLTKEQAGFRYAPGKWSIREVIGHIVDTERVLGYRALCVARGEVRSLPSFDENDYAAAAGHDHHPLPELVDEFRELRRSHILMLRHLDDSAWQRVGCVNEHPISTREIGRAHV